MSLLIACFLQAAVELHASRGFFSFTWIYIVSSEYLLGISVITMSTLQMKKLRLRSQWSSEGQSWDLSPRLYSLHCPDSTMFREGGGAITGEGELMHSFWMCWLGGAHETSRRIDEFGDWGRSNSKEKEFVLGNYILRFAYSEHQSFDLPCGISREEF